MAARGSRGASRGGAGTNARGRGANVNNRLITARNEFINWLGNNMATPRFSSEFRARQVVERFIPAASTPRFIQSMTAARTKWNPSDAARANLDALLSGQLTTAGTRGKSSFSIKKDPNPAAVMLYMLDYRLKHSMETPENVKNRGYVITIHGTDNNGEKKAISRAIDPGNVHQVLGLAASITGGLTAAEGEPGSNSNPLDFQGTSNGQSDFDLMEFNYLTNVSSIDVSVSFADTIVDEEGNETEVSEGGNFLPVSSDQPLASSILPSPTPRVRRAAAVASQQRTKALMRPRRGGSFFRFWLCESFPESLAIIQVYKKSETERLVRDLSMKEGEFSKVNTMDKFEISCIASSFIVQGLPVEKYFILFQESCSRDTPVFPSARFGDLCKALGVNGVLTMYSSTNMIRGRKRREFSYGKEGDEKVYYVGRVEDHFIPDVESGWAMAAIRNFIYFQRKSGRAYYSLPLHKRKLLRKIENRAVNSLGISFRFANREKDEFATYGEMLSVLLWGSVVSHTGEESFRQQPLVEPMTVENICLRAELYLHFQSMLKTIDLPCSFMGDAKLEEFIDENSRLIEKQRRLVLNKPFGSANPDTWGTFRSRIQLSGLVYSHHLARVYYKQYGASFAREWEFRDVHSIDSGVRMIEGGEGTTVLEIEKKSTEPEKVKKVFFSVPLPFTIIAFDSETMCVPNSFAEGVVKYYEKFFTNSMNADFNSAVERSEFDPATVDAELSVEGLSDFEHFISSANDDTDEQTKKEEMNVHYPYCVSICYVADSRARPYNFRDMEYLHNQHPPTQVGAEQKCFGEEMFDLIPNIHLVKKTFLGLDCMIQLCAFLGSSLFNDISIHLIAHNARYDINMLMRYSFAVISGGIFRSASRMNCCELKIQAFPSISYESLIDNQTYTLRRGSIYRRSNVWMHYRVVHVQCTLATTGIPLSAFASTFRMKIKKEFMPYSLYTLERLFENFAPSPMMNVPTIRYLSTLPIEEVWNHTEAKDCDEFKNSVLKAKALVETSTMESESYSINLWRYAQYYCEMDCKVLLKGFLSLRKEMYQLQIPSPGQTKIDPLTSPYCALRLENAVSLPQFANHYFGLCGVYDGVFESKGVLMSFMRRGVTGGKTMLAANSPVIFDAFKMGKGMEDAIEDLDAVSQYPSAMKEIADEYGGFPKGAPKIWDATQSNRSNGLEARDYTSLVPSFILNSHYYFLLVRIRKLGRALRFPIVNGPRECFPMFNEPDTAMFTELREELEEEDTFSSAEEIYSKLTSRCSSRHFTNHPEGARLVIDKFTFEDIIQYHRGAEVEVIQALYWDQGGTTAIGSVIEYLFDSRVKLVAEGRKAAAQARKLTMNSGYGRFLMNAPDSTHYFVEGSDNIKRYLSRHSCTTKNAVLIRNDFAVVERRKGVQNFFNASHLGAMVLSVSKRIMNRVMVTYEDLFERGDISDFRMFYMDTDSIHICNSHIILLFEEYAKRYHKRILVTPGVETHYSGAESRLGMFNTDFDPLPGATPPSSILFVGVMKKVYLDTMICWDSKLAPEEQTLSNFIQSFHARMKGVPSKCTYETAKAEGIMMNDLYLHLIRGLGVTFDLSKYTTRFEMNKNFSVTTNTCFKRIVKLNPYLVIIAHIEWVKNGFSFDSFPYLKSMTEYMGSQADFYTDYHKWFKWDVIREAGAENFHYSCKNPGPFIHDLHSISSSSSSSSCFAIPDSQVSLLPPPVSINDSYSLSPILPLRGNDDGFNLDLFSDESFENSSFLDGDYIKSPCIFDMYLD